MPTETTPLLPPRRRTLSGLPLAKRFAVLSIRIATIFVVLTVTTFAVVLLGPWNGQSIRNSIYGGWRDRLGGLSHEEVKKILVETPTGNKAREWSEYYTSGLHLAGKNLSQAIWTRDKWSNWGVNSDISTYNVYINYPQDHSLSLFDTKHGKSVYKASLEEDILPEDPSTSLPNKVPTFHGYSASGNVTGQFVYVNYGTYADYDDLLALGIDLKGKIALARYGGIFRGLKVKRAEELGMAGVVLFTDPGDDGEKTKENGYEEYPNGPARHPSSVQRGSTQYLSVRPGDPTTPGYPSKPGVPRADVKGAIPSIPSLPISYRDALPILKALNGIGPAVTDLNKYWNRNLGLKYLGVNYNVGPSPKNLVLNLNNQQKYVTTPLWNVIGIINGTLSNEVIVLGNHRDAWIVGGSVDPNSGSAVLNEVVRSVGVALAKGWKPLRTIVFASWDGEEYGLVGSTEWVEEYLPWLSGANVAYVNVDVGVGGPHFDAAAAPLLHPVLRKAAGEIISPNQTVLGQKIGDLWTTPIRTMGSGSDFTAFQDFAGIPSIDMGFKADGGSAAYHYHSNYDSFYWMENFGDPGFKYHKAMAQLTGVVLSELANSPVIPFSATKYAEEFSRYLDAIGAKIDSATAKSIQDLQHAENRTMKILGMTPDDILFASRSHPAPIKSTISSETPESLKRHVEALRKTLAKFHKAAAALDKTAASVTLDLRNGLPWYRFYRLPALLRSLILTNHRYKYLERAFLYEKGLDGRDWFKHVVFAPGLWTGYAGAVFPGVVEGIDEGDWEKAVQWVGIIQQCFEKGVEGIEETDIPNLGELESNIEMREAVLKR